MASNSLEFEARNVAKIGWVLIFFGIAVGLVNQAGGVVFWGAGLFLQFIAGIGQLFFDGKIDP